MVDSIEQRNPQGDSAGELESISDNIGLPVSYDLAFYQTDSIGPQDADMLIQLKPRHRPTAAISRTESAQVAGGAISRRDELFPGRRYHQPGAELRSARGDRRADLRQRSAIAITISRSRLAERMTPDSRRRRPAHRRAAGLSGLRGQRRSRQGAARWASPSSRWPPACSLRFAANSLLQPSFWLDPESGVNYNVIAQTPQHLDRFGCARWPTSR